MPTAPELPVWQRILMMGNDPRSIRGGNPTPRPLGEQVSERVGDALESINPMELLYKLRYGMGTGEFQKMKTSGRIPGATANPGLERDDEEQRRTAAYLFARKWPRAAEALQPSVNTLRGVSGIGPPNPFGDDPRQAELLKKVAEQASARGVSDALARMLAKRRLAGLTGEEGDLGGPEIPE